MPLSHVVRNVAVNDTTIAVTVFGIPQVLFFRPTWVVGGSAEVDPAMVDRASAVAIDFVGRVVMPAAATDITFLAESDCSEPTVLATLVEGSIVAVGAQSLSIVPSTIASAITAAVVLTRSVAQCTEHIVPSPFDMAFAGGAMKPVELKALVADSAGQAAAFVAQQQA
jgi:hypothetical protein